MVPYILRLWQKRVVKFAVVGVLGIPINLVALAFFLQIFRLYGLQDDMLEAAATISSFEVATMINFVLNQVITYAEQIPGTLQAWIVKAGKAQLANITAFLLVTLISIFFSVVLELNPFISNTLGIGCNFLYKFFLADRYVFAARQPATCRVSHTTKVPILLDDTTITPGASKRL